MKANEIKQDAGTQYVQSEKAVEALVKIFSNRDELEAKQQEVRENVVKLQEKVERLAEKFAMATDPEESKRLQRELREARYDLEDAKLVSQIDIGPEIRRQVSEAMPLLELAHKEFDPLVKQTREKIKAIKDKAEADVKELEAALKAHPFRKAHAMREQLLYYSKK